MTDVPATVRSIAAHGLSGARGAWPSTPFDEEAWAGLLAVVREQRLAGLLVDAIAHGSLPATSSQAAQARAEHFTGIVHVLDLETGMLETVGQLAAAGVEARVLKGSAVANLDYPDPALRLFVDVDLIVRSDQFDHAVAALVTAGHVRRHPQPRPGFDRRFSKGTSFIVADRLSLDLHRTFVMGPFGLRVRLEDLWGPGERFTVAGVELSALGRETRFLHACFHAALGDAVPRLVPQRDVAQMLQNDRLDIHRVEQLMRRWQAEPVVAHAITHTWRTLRLTSSTPITDWALNYRPSIRSARELALYSDPEGSYARKSLAAVRVVPGLRDKAAFAYALTFPERSYVEGRYSTAWRRWWIGLRAVTGKRRARRSPEL